MGGAFSAPDRDGRLLSPSPKATLKSHEQGLTVWLTNGSKQVVWFQAADSHVLGWLEAKDQRGQWRPIEYFQQYTCGNSYHRVALEPNHGWNWQVPLAKGGLKTLVRWRMLVEGGELVSNAISTTILPTKFELDAKVAQHYDLTLEWVRPTLKYKR